jgi:hypothetical protein
MATTPEMKIATVKAFMVTCIEGRDNLLRIELELA